MATKGKYNTKQRSELINYLESVPGQHVTISDMCDYFEGIGSGIGRTTIYRQMERLVDEGIVNKYIIDANSPACFEYIKKEEHGHEETDCFHCKCEKCGKLIHLHCDELRMIKRHLEKHHSFFLDPLRTVFYGVCEDCR